MSSEQSDSMPFIDGRCGCHKCEERTKNVYRMVGYCGNCKTEPILILYRAGDPAAPKDCPICGGWHTVNARRLATPDEIPAGSSS